MPKPWTPPPASTLAECHVAFETVLVRSTYGEHNDRWPAYVNADLLAAFAADNVLGRDALVPRHDARMAERFPRTAPRPTPDRRAWESAGNALHWGVRLGLLTEETGPDGGRAWRLVRREPTYALDKRWRVEQIAGLAPEAQAARDRKAATQAKLTATLARKACEKAIKGLSWRLGGLLEQEPGAIVPQAWADEGYVPGWTAGVPISACFDTIRDAPLAGEFSKPKLTAWELAIIAETSRVRARAYDRRAEHRRIVEASPAPRLAVIVDTAIAGPVPGEADVPDEDLDALGSL